MSEKEPEMGDLTAPQNKDWNILLSLFWQVAVKQRATPPCKSQYFTYKSDQTKNVCLLSLASVFMDSSMELVHAYKKWIFAHLTFDCAWTQSKH